jgi:alpha-mannosidase
VLCGDEPLIAESVSLLEIEPSALVLSAFKPAENGKGIVLRILNPTTTVQEARISIGFPFEKAELLRLDETPETSSPRREGQMLHFPVPPHALRTLGIE